MLRQFFQKRVNDRTPTDRPSPWGNLIMVILAVGVVAVAIADKDFRQPFFVVAGSILSTHFVGKNSGSKQ